MQSLYLVGCERGGGGEKRGTDMHSREVRMFPGRTR